MAKDTLGINAGQFYTECGRLLSGKSPRFYLGRTDEISEDAARVRRAHVRSFWERTQSGPPSEDERGIWSDVKLTWAKQIAKGANSIVIGDESRSLTTTPLNLLVYGKVADSLNRTYAGIVRFVLPPNVTGFIGNVAQLVESAADATTGTDDGENLHKWLNAFADHSFTTMLKIDDETEKHEHTEWAKVFSDSVRRLKDWADDISLKSFGYVELERIVQKIASRPISKKSGRPISVKYTRHSLKALRRFIRWLPKHAPGWGKPEDWEELFEQHRPTATADEKSQRAIGKVKAYSVEQLEVIYRYATPFERLLFLLGINCGFGAAELSTLRLREIVLNAGGDSFIKRVRLKTESGVYGEHWLFPHSVLALEWAVERAKKIKGGITLKSFIILRDSGKRLVTKSAGGNRTNKAANTWAGLTNRIRRDDSTFPVLSFGNQTLTDSSSGVPPLPSASV